MDKAIDVHDHAIRTQLGRFGGYEVTTEGDAFLMAFHDASDAVAWSAATQQVSPTSCYAPSASNMWFWLLVLLLPGGTGGGVFCSSNHKWSSCLSLFCCHPAVTLLRGLCQQ